MRGKGWRKKRVSSKTNLKYFFSTDLHSVALVITSCAPLRRHFKGNPQRAQAACQEQQRPHTPPSCSQPLPAPPSAALHQRYPSGPPELSQPARLGARWGPTCIPGLAAGAAVPAAPVQRLVLGPAVGGAVAAAAGAGPEAAADAAQAGAVVEPLGRSQGARRGILGGRLLGVEAVPPRQLAPEHCGERRRSAGPGRAAGRPPHRRHPPGSPQSGPPGPGRR